VRARFGFLPALTVSAASGCLVLAPLDDPSPLGVGGTGAAGGTAGLGGGSGRGGATSGDAGAGGEPLSAGGGSGTGGAPAKGGGAGKGGSGARGGKGGTGGSDEPPGGAGDGGTPGDNGCSTNDECVKLGGNEPYLCRHEDRTCVPLKTNDCPLAYGDYRHENPIYFGSFGFLRDSSPADNVTVWSSRLAVDDINAAGGLPVAPDGDSRPLVMVVCNSNTDQHPGVIDRGMAHLANEVRVQSILATLRPADLQRAFEAHVAKDLFFLSPISLTSTLTDALYPKGELIWNLLGQPSDFAPAYAKLLAHLEAYLRDLRTLPDPDANPLKVALVTTTDEFDADLQTFVFPRLRFNANKSAAQNGDNFLNVELDAANPDIEQARGDIIDFAPDIIVSTASDVMTEQGGLIGQIEATWAQTHRPTEERPYFILSPYNAGDLGSLSPIVDGLHRNEDVNAHRHFLGISAASALDPTLQNEYATRLRKTYGTEANVDTGNYFDAVYTLAYAMVAAHGPLTGPNLAAAMPRLLAGEPFGTRPDDIDGALAWLADPAGTIELSGTLGPPDFDLETGVRAATPAVFCYQFDGLLSVEEQVLRYDRGADAFTGSYPCIDGFAP
jgi:hypothetical protein